MPHQIRTWNDFKELCSPSAKVLYRFRANGTSSEVTVKAGNIFFVGEFEEGDKTLEKIKEFCTANGYEVVRSAYEEQVFA